MRLNTDSIEVEFEQKLFDTLVKIFNYKGKVKQSPTVVIESGMFKGQGTTDLIAKAIVKAKKENKVLFYTLESNPQIFQIGKNNVSKYSFIQPLYAMSLNLNEGLDFIANDDIYKHPDDFDIIVDAENPIFFYRTELFSCYHENPNPPIEGIFYDLIPQFRDQTVLFSLDSCGGIGYLEYTKVKELMAGNKFYLMIDDCNHCKHFRSYQEIKNNDKWDMMFYNGRVAIAYFKGE